MRRNYVFCLVVVCCTILALVWMVRGSLCEFHIKQGNTKLSAYLAYKVEQR
ncbi:small toxic polypeptide [Salmonella enterica subsp. enterica serovar Montevideo]|nr:Hok/Gef family protein [Salmonella enterica]EBQ9480280.1 Hok/Gef family protein [Salmonella enterica subsp. enterica serovar Kokomlemle]EBZ8769372.1 Hok/Gef family protein [Salmonella enterica subsp. enterica serovar Typhimurium]ECC9043007.1 Hok/Gef family protein [Salmonella enterica subsp. enterica]EDV0637621.1 Hok/Gef family protein [Salmonella enterica subsp. enterica serovar Lexington]EHC1063841.1 Hok/Gef family protein [Salmonella enterica subsp. enterica serovar Chomedey]EHG0012394.